MHRPLHAAGYFLNPEFFYANPNIAQDGEIMTGMYNCISKLVSSIENQDEITSEMTIYIKVEGLFGLSLAVRQQATRAPGNLFYKFS